MAYETRKVAAFGVIGFLIALMIITGVSSYPTLYPTLFPPPITTLPPTTAVSKMGTLVLMLTDAPPRNLTDLYINITEVRLHMKGNETGEGPIIDFPVEGGWLWVDVTELHNISVLVGAGAVPAGNYTAIWLRIANANATFAEAPSENVSLKVVAQGWLKILMRFEVNAGALAIETLDFDLGQTHISASNVLRPVIKPKQD